MQSALELLREMRETRKGLSGGITTALHNHCSPPAHNTQNTQKARLPVAKLRLSTFAVSGRVVAVRSDLLAETIWLASDNADISGLLSGGVVYRANEMPALVGLDADALRMLHSLKRQFGPGTVVDFEDGNGERGT